MYRQFIEWQMLDISREPMEVAPTAHYRVGGIVVDPETHATTGVGGLYAAGERVGGVHGANRLVATRSVRPGSPAVARARRLRPSRSKAKPSLGRGEWSKRRSMTST